MAEGFEPFHVPQQSRRDKLRVILQENPSCEETAVATNTLHGFSGLFPPYDPSLLSSSMLTCANEVPYQFHHQNTMFGEAGEPSKQNPVSNVKEEGLNLMGCVAGFMNASSSFTNPNSSIQHINNNDKNNINPFLYASQNPRNFVPLTQNYMTTGQSLSLSLSSQNLQEHDSSEIGEKGIGEYVVRRIFGGGASTSTNFSRSLVPFGPFTGYATILKGSRFLRPAQLLLEELCDVGRGIYADRSSVYSSAMESPVSPEILAGTGTAEDSLSSGDYGKHRKKTTTTLLSMLDEVYRRYRQYYQQMQAVATSFESVAGLANAAPYTSFALKAMSKHFKCLKNAITDQLRFTSKALGEGSFRKDENPSFGTFDRDHSQRPIHSSGILEQHVWRPQRGLPERAVAVLRAWLFEHFLHPYPTDTDKQMLAKQTGLSRNQVSNWFINARVRLWKPMVEEIHMLETRQALKDQEPDDRRANEPSDNLPPENLISPPNPTLATSHTQDPPLKRSRNELPFIPGRSSELPANFSYTTSSSGNNGVSLALGLHQNNGIVFSEPFSMNIAQRFGLETNNEGYNVGSLGAQNAHFGKDIRGQLLRDFVGQ